MVSCFPQFPRKRYISLRLDVDLDDGEHYIKRRSVKCTSDLWSARARFYWERWEDSDELMKNRIIFEKILQQEIDEFGSRPIIEQVSYVNNIAVLMFLMIIRESIVATAKPEKEFVANINMIHFGNIFNRARNMILDNVEKKGERYATQCLLTIDKLASLYIEAKHEIEGFQQM